MLNSAIFLKTFRDSAVSLLLAIVGLIAFQILFVWAMLNMGTEVLEFVSKVPFITKMFEMSLGIKVDGEVSLNILFAVCYTHAVALSLVWFVVISTVTRTTVGEVERGTADMLLTLPVSRPEVYFSTSLVWWTITAILSYVPIVGMWDWTTDLQSRRDRRHLSLYRAGDKLPMPPFVRWRTGINGFLSRRSSRSRSGRDRFDCSCFRRSKLKQSKEPNGLDRFDERLNEVPSTRRCRSNRRVANWQYGRACFGCRRLLDHWIDRIFKA